MIAETKRTTYTFKVCFSNNSGAKAAKRNAIRRENGKEMIADEMLTFIAKALTAANVPMTPAIAVAAVIKYCFGVEETTSFLKKGIVNKSHTCPKISIQSVVLQ